jgi:hypothetical protein
MQDRRPSGVVFGVREIACGLSSWGKHRTRAVPGNSEPCGRCEDFVGTGRASCRPSGVPGRAGRVPVAGRVHAQAPVHHDVDPGLREAPGRLLVPDSGLHPDHRRTALRGESEDLVRVRGTVSERRKSCTTSTRSGTEARSGTTGSRGIRGASGSPRTRGSHARAACPDRERGGVRVGPILDPDHRDGPAGPHDVGECFLGLDDGSRAHQYACLRASG